MLDVHQSVTDAIVAAIEANPGSARMPWHRGTANQIPMNIVSGNEYQGITHRHPDCSDAHPGRRFAT